MNVHDIGDRVKLVLTFADYDDVPTSATVVCYVEDPDGIEEELTATLQSTGVYHAFKTVDKSGTWRVRTASTGALVSAEEGAFVVRKSWFA